MAMCLGAGIAEKPTGARGPKATRIFFLYNPIPSKNLAQNISSLSFCVCEMVAGKFAVGVVGVI